MLWGIVLCWLTACVAPAAPPAQSAGSINVARQAALAQTTQLELLKFDEKAARYVLVTSITDKTVITDIVQVLDKELPIQPALRCIDQYQLKFHLVTGVVQTFGYYCTATDAYLNGGPLPDGQAVQPPSALGEILLKQTSTN